MKQTIVVTGASRGIGRAAALAFAGKDIHIAINCIRNEKLLSELKNELTDAGADCMAFVGDISDPDAASAFFDEIYARFGTVDVLVNNAGISSVGLFQELSSTDWNRVMQVNVSSVYNCCRLAIPHMVRAKSGRIINISSVWGICGASCEAAYSASKGAVNSLTKALAKELAPSNIQVNAIACGAIDTEMNSFLSDEERQALIDEIPAGRLGTPEEAAELVRLVAMAPPYMTGQIISLDGGWI